MRSKKRREVEEIGLDNFYEKISRLYEENRFDEAISITRETIRKFPYNPEPYIWLGDLLFETSDIEGALDAYKKAIDADDKNPEAHSAAAKMYFLLCDFTKAERHTDIALNNNPEDADSLYLKALLLDRKHDFSLADQYLRKANLTDPENYPRPIYLSNEHFEALVNFVFQNLSEKLKEFKKYISIVSDDIPSDEEIKSGVLPLTLSRLVVYEENSQKNFRIKIYRRNILHFSQNEDELRENINICLLNEVNKMLTALESEKKDEKQR